MFERISNIVRCATFCTGNLKFKIVPKSFTAFTLIDILWFFL